MMECDWAFPQEHGFICNGTLMHYMISKWSLLLHNEHAPLVTMIYV